jgi:hypothetical protein
MVGQSDFFTEIVVCHSDPELVEGEEPPRILPLTFTKTKRIVISPKLLTISS